MIFWYSKNNVPIKLALVLFSSAISFNAFPQAGHEICQSRLLDKELEIRYNLEPKSPPVNTQMAPFNFDTRWGKLGSSENFRGLSGYYCDAVNNHPTIYASSSGYTVVGSNYEKTFKLTELNLAFVAYKKLLIRSGYGK
jgi:hypothetical protein